jgi:hypothetical protein
MGNILQELYDVSQSSFSSSGATVGITSGCEKVIFQYLI